MSAPAHVARHLTMVMSAAFLWGTVGVTTQAIYHLDATNPLSIGCLRLALAAPVLIIAAFASHDRPVLCIARRDLGVIVLIGLMLALYQACYFAAIARVGVTVATLVTLCLAPVFVALLAARFTNERLTPIVIASLVVALVGVICVVLGKAGGAALNSDVIGVLLATGAALSYSIITLAGRRVATRYHALHINAIAFTVGALVLFMVALPTGFVTKYSAPGWLLLGYLGVAPTAVAYGIFLRGMRATPATVASIATLLEPLTATILAALVLGEHLAPLGHLGDHCGARRAGALELATPWWLAATLRLPT